VAVAFPPPSLVAEAVVVAREVTSSADPSVELTAPVADPVMELMAEAVVAVDWAADAEPPDVTGPAVPVVTDSAVVALATFDAIVVAVAGEPALQPGRKLGEYVSVPE